MTKTLLILLTAFASLSLHAAEPAKPKWMAAKELLDEHFDDDAVLKSAAKLLIAARAETPKDPNLYVQAARLTIKGGGVFPSDFSQGKVEAYAELLDKALAIDPNHKKALVLRAEAYSLAGNLAKEKATLELANKAPGTDRWLHIGWARYANSTKNSTSAYYSYEAVEKLGPGESVEQRNAYVFALGALLDFRPPPDEPYRLEEFAELARKHKSPKDYKVGATFARHFLFNGMYPEALDHARESMRVRKTGNAALSVAAALYGEAGNRALAGDKAGATKLAKEAKALGFEKTRVLDRLSGPSNAFTAILPHLEGLME